MRINGREAAPQKKATTMLTTKFVTLHDGKEVISECHSVIADRCDNGMLRVAVHSSIPGMPDDDVGYYFGDGPVKHDGRQLPRYATLYVMNRAGATISVYHFEKSNVPVETLPPEALQVA
jgi:hypothetical protein